LISFTRWSIATALGLNILLAPLSPMMAAENPKTKRTNVDFEDQLVQGEVKKPELFYLLQKKNFNFGKLIKLRENFIPEMQKSAEDVEKGK
jgi:hypothetical protein